MKGQLRAATPTEYVAQLDEPRKSEVVKLDRFIRKTTPKLKPVIMNGMLGYGPVRYKYASGREGDMCTLGIASNARGISLYVFASDAKGWVAERYRARLPGAKIGKSCVVFKRFEDLEPKALTAMLKDAAKTGFTS